MASFASDQFDSPGVDVALARRLIGEAGTNLDRAIERAVFLDHDTYRDLYALIADMPEAAELRDRLPVPSES